VKPADIGIEGLMSLYVSMGVTARQPGIAPTIIKPPPLVSSGPTAPADSAPAQAKQQ
jgi:hypothetical protein